MNRKLLTALIPALALAATPPAQALEVAGIGGHMTDPDHKLSDADKSAIEERLTKIQEDTHIDLAGWISDTSEDEASAYGLEFYKKWNIGNDWDNGAFLMFPRSGRVHVLVNPDKPLLTPEEAAQLASADEPGEEMHRRLERLTDKAREILVPKTENKTRPWGTAHPDRGRVYALGTALIALCGFGITGLRWRRQRSARFPGLDTDRPSR